MSNHRTEHLIPLLTDDLHNWATLKLLTDSLNEKDLPLIVQGSPVQGVLMLDLSKKRASLLGYGKKEEHVERIDVVVTGKIRPFERAEVQNMRDPSVEFLHLQHTIWTGDPQDATLPAEPLNIPFRISLPGTVEMRPDGGMEGEDKKASPLPTSFSVPEVRTSIFYEVSVHFYEGVVHTDHEIRSLFRYVPRVQPPPPSDARAQAYKDGAPLAGPKQDPDGWQVCGSVKVDDGECTVALGKPLIYTKGCPIPIFVSSPSTSTPLSAVLRAHYTQRPNVVGSAAHTHLPELEYSDESHTQDLRQAVFWQGEGGGWMGEVIVPPRAKVGCAIGWFDFKYTVSFYPALGPDTQRSSHSHTNALKNVIHSLTADTNKTDRAHFSGKPLLEVPIEIATFFAPDTPRPSARAPKELKGKENEEEVVEWRMMY